jgi:aldehyde dehydrogenase (NAD+)
MTTDLRPGRLDLACRIAGRRHDAPERIVVTHPYDGAVVGSAPSLDAAQVTRALDVASAYRDRLSRHERSELLTRIAARIAADADQVARTITAESGLALRDARHEARRTIDVFRVAAMEALRDDGAVFACDTSVNGRARRAFTTREPVRAVAAITPFNHPLNQVAHKLAPALAAGAPIVLKPSEKTPLSALWLAGVVDEVGVPHGAVAVVTGDRRTVLDAFLAHPAVEVVCFTGSVAVCKEIASRLGYRRAILELGGNDPLLVLRDADLDVAVGLALAGAFGNSGQRCTAVKRIVADEAVAPALAERLAEAASGLVAGDPTDEATDVGTVIDEAAAERVEARIAAAVADGAVLLCGGERRGALVAPAVLDHVRPAMALVADETFGPVAPIIRVRGLDEAIAVANATPYGLSSGVVTNDLAAAVRCVHELRCGTVNVNEVPGFRTELTPFGGVGDSGLGVKEGVLEAMRGMTTTKLYTLPWPRGE